MQVGGKMSGDTEWIPPAENYRMGGGWKYSTVLAWIPRERKGLTGKSPEDKPFGGGSKWG